MARAMVRISRRGLLGLMLVSLVYPLLRFVSHRLPKKPKLVEVTTKAPLSGVVVQQDFILFDREDKAWAVTRRCTHLGCRLNYHELENLLECPCHQSRFSPEGLVLQGPAKENLTTFAVEKRTEAPFYIVTI